MISCNYLGLKTKTSLTRHMLLNYLYQARKVSGHVCVWQGSQFCLFLQFCYWILELFRQCGICCFSVRFQNCSDSVVFVVFYEFRTGQTMWYLLSFMILELFRQCGICCFYFRFQNCSDSVIFAVFYDFETVQTVWYLQFFCQILELFRQCAICCFL